MKEQNNKPTKLNSMLQKKQKLNNKVINLSSILKKKIKQNKNKFSDSSKQSNSEISPKQHNLEKLLSKDNKQEERKKRKVNEKPQSLRDRMMTKLKASRFRYLNETLYNNESSESKKYFKNDPDAFKAYHEGYKQQIEQWPLNPLDVIISSIKKMLVYSTYSTYCYNYKLIFNCYINPYIHIYIYINHVIDQNII